MRQAEGAERRLHRGQKLKKPGLAAGLCSELGCFLFVEEAELLLEARNTSATVKNGLGAAGPGWM